MATNDTAAPRPSSPTHDKAPAPALGPTPLQRCLSTASTTSQGSSSDVRESMGSTSSRQSSMTFSSTSSRHSDLSMLSTSAPYNPPNNRATIHAERPRKNRGYVRPQGTDFAASARQRESVLSLGSINHLQYYFARTGLLDGKGGHAKRSRKKQRARPATLDLSMLRSDRTTSPRLSLLSPKQPGDTPPGSLGGSPDLVPAGVLAGSVVQSPIDADGDVDGEFDSQFFLDEYDEPDPDVPPPTTSTYNYREKPLPPPPSIVELKSELTAALENASKSLDEVIISDAPSQPNSPARGGATSDSPKGKAQPAGWYEIQGIHVLDVVTLAIRAAKMYYTAHPHPDRLDAVKPERELRAGLLSVMDTLRKSASRSFANGFKLDEHKIMTEWIASVRDTLAKEEAVEDAERKKREAWSWLRGDPASNDTEREMEFLQCMLAAPYAPVVEEPARKVSGTRTSTAEKEAIEKEKRKSASSITEDEPLPEFTSASTVPEDQLPTPFLAYFRNGIRLIRLHNAAVRASRRRFGAIGTYHKDTAVTYRAAENIRFWAKAAELRWEIILKVDALAVVQGAGGAQAWINFETAILEWARRVRTEITGEMED